MSALRKVRINCRKTEVVVITAIGVLERKRSNNLYIGKTEILTKDMKFAHADSQIFELQGR